MKKIMMAAVLILCISAGTKIHAFGLGAQVNFMAGKVFAPGASVVLSPTDYLHLAVNWYLDFENVNTVGLTFDAIPLTLPIAKFGAGSFNFTLGAGFFSNIEFKKKPTVNGGLRIPVGFNLLLGKRIFEIYTHVAPSFGVRFLPNLGLTDPFFPIAIGARIWFRFKDK